MINIIAKQKKRRNKIKYTVHGFNQIEAIKLGLSTDDLAVLKWFIDFQSTNAMERNYIEEVNDMGYWVDYSTLIDALPILLADGNTYLQRFLELEQLLEEGKFKEYKIKRRKYHETYRKKVNRILAGPLSQVLKKDKMKVLGNEKGSKIYIYIDRENYSKLLLNTNMETYLAENGISIEKSSSINNVDKMDKKHVDTVDKNTDERFVPDRCETPVPDRCETPVPDRCETPVPDRCETPDSYLNHSSVIYSIASNSYTQSKEDGEDLKFYLNLKTNKDKEMYLQNKFDITDNDIMNIYLVVDLGIEEGSIKSKKYSKGYWSYIYKTCKSRYEKKLTHIGQYELAQ